MAVLFAGLTGAALIYMFSANDSAGGASVEIGSRRSSEFQIERIGGKAAVYAVRFNEWLAGLWQGRQLAITVGALSLVIALLCFWIAGSVSARTSGNQDEGRQSD